MATHILIVKKDAGKNYPVWVKIISSTATEIKGRIDTKELPPSIGAYKDKIIVSPLDVIAELDENEEV
jgi:hypothetical protein